MEGQLDALMAHQFGFTNAIGSGGTAITWEHANYLRHIPTAVLALDGDLSGVNAAIKTISNLARYGQSVKIAVFPKDPDTGKGHDPDSFLRSREHGPDAFAKLIEGAQPWFEAYVEFLHKQFDTHTIEGRHRIGKELARSIATVSNPFEKSEYVQRIATEFQIGTELLIEMMNQGMTIFDKKRKKNEAYSPEDLASLADSIPIVSDSLKIEMDIASNLIHNPEVDENITSQINLDHFSEPGVRELVRQRLAMPDYKPGTSLQDLRQLIADSDRLSPYALQVVESNPEFPMWEESLDDEERWDYYIEHGLKALQIRHDRRKLNQVSHEIIQASDEERPQLLEEMLQIIDPEGKTKEPISQEKKEGTNRPSRRQQIAAEKKKQGQLF